jgi:hypothetical protein
MARRRSGAGDAFSALIFNAAMLALPFAAAPAWRDCEQAHVYGYHLSPSSLAAARRGLEDAAGTMVPEGAERRVYWNSLVERELDAGDFSAARGFLLLAPAMLNTADAVRLETQLPPRASDTAIERAAMGFLEDDTRARYGDVAASAVQSGQADVLILGDLRDLAIASSDYVNGKPTDEELLILSGLGLAMGDGAPPAEAAAVSAGASVMKIAKRAGGLSDTFEAAMRERLFAACPPARLRRELTAALAAAPIGTEEAASVQAFRRSIDMDGYRTLMGELGTIAGVAKTIGVARAAILLESARSLSDLPRLELLAAAGNDRAVAIGKRGEPAQLFDAARPTLLLTQQASVSLALLGLALCGVLLPTLATLSGALLRAWRGGELRPEQDERVAELQV